MRQKTNTRACANTMKSKKKMSTSRHGGSLHNKRDAVRKTRKTHAGGALQLARRQYEQQKKAADEKKKLEEADRARKVEAFKVSNEKRCRKRQKMNEKTKKGQPVMANRIDMLLTKIQAST
ncbi:uncharacterized protein LOC134188957 [Corticium candelabrum]|uniref:uncharacterized protein LOC134188957 n=1 Tax=Corticium candelabrum TaxID=121492 RepID=UPI002E2716E2|nr:uncharacterized protein LOC134188957 [Corticium candelabrum]